MQLHIIICIKVQLLWQQINIYRYYKKFNIPDMQRCQLPLEQKALSIGHANNTLIITVCYNIVLVYYLTVLFVQYKKPAIIIELEKTLKEVYSKAKASKDGDVDCSPS